MDDEIPLWVSFDNYREIFASNVAQRPPDFLIESDKTLNYFIKNQKIQSDTAAAYLLFSSVNSLRSSMILICGGAVFQSIPLLRLATEASLYAFFVRGDEGAKSHWLKREESEISRKYVRNKLLKEAKTKLREVDGILFDEFGKVYQLLIDQGAHPNPKSILPLAHRMDPDVDGNVLMTFEQLTPSPTVRVAFASIHVRTCRLVASIAGKMFPNAYALLGISEKFDNIMRDAKQQFDAQCRSKAN